jgi:hypothetical protein
MHGLLAIHLFFFLFSQILGTQKGESCPKALGDHSQQPVLSDNALFIFL